MKWTFGLALAAFCCISCDNELVVTDNWKDIPVVWGIISKSDTAHYIRVEKAFLDPNTSALEIARIPDSLYYEEATVSLKRIASGQVYNLLRIDGANEGYPRKEGIFAETPNYLYKIKANQISLVEGERYEFRLVRNDHTEPVTAETVILPQPVLRNPVPGSSLPFRPNSPYIFNWNDMPGAGVFELHLRFHFRERSPETGNVYIPKTIEWTLARNLKAVQYRMEGVEFFNNLKALIPQHSQATRVFDSIEIVLWCAGAELDEFIRIIQANTGLTSTQDIPVYTNLSEGYGLFTSRNVSYYTGFGLTSLALDSLKNSSITKDLNFQ